MDSIHRNLYNRVLASVRAGNFSIRKLKSTITFDGKGIFTIGKKLLVDKNLEWALQRGGPGSGASTVNKVYLGCPGAQQKKKLNFQKGIFVTGNSAARALTIVSRV